MENTQDHNTETQSMKVTSLYDEHLKLKAKMLPFGGFNMPIQYTSVKEEVLAVRNQVGIFDVSHMGEFFVRGRDAINFVDYLITNDFKNAEFNKAVYSPLCRDNGTIIDDLIAYKLSPEEVLICVNASNIDKDWSWICTQYEKMQSTFHVTISNESNDYSLIAIQGPKAKELLLNIHAFTEAEEKEFLYYSILKKSFPTELNSPGTMMIARTGYTGEDGFEVFANHKQIKILWNEFIRLGGTPCGLAARDVLRLEVCYPLYGHELTDEVTPLDTGLLWTVKFQKENFIGKQSLLDLHSKGAPYQLVKLSLEKGIPREGYRVLNSDLTPVGVVTSGTMSVVLNKGIAMAKVKKELLKGDKKYFIEIRSNSIEANYHTQSFIKGGHK